ncbi:MAG: glycoside hydrolase, partial [Acidobacteria bacterium]
MQTSTYRSTDGGQTFAAFKGAPGGDDYHVLWMDPQNTNRMILGVDQGATISVDGGKTWSSWYNQPTGQFYHVITDNQFPYVAYAPQQDSGTAAVPSRSDYGEISFRDWFSIGGFEFCYIAPDPL